MDINATLFGQMLTFGVLVWFTMKFVWPNLQATLKARQAKIAEGLAAGKRGEQVLQEADKKAAAQLQAAHQKAQDIFDRAEQQALEHFLEMKKIAELERAKIVQAGHEQIQQAMMQAQAELKNQLADLVVASTEKMLARALSGSDETYLLNTLVQNTDWTVLDSARKTNA